jgi:hypothetical protein
MLAIMKNIFIVSLIVLAAADDGSWFSYFLPSEAARLEIRCTHANVFDHSRVLSVCTSTR